MSREAWISSWSKNNYLICISFKVKQDRYPLTFTSYIIVDSCYGLSIIIFILCPILLVGGPPSNGARSVVWQSRDAVGSNYSIQEASFNWYRYYLQKNLAISLWLISDTFRYFLFLRTVCREEPSYRWSHQGWCSTTLRGTSLKEWYATVAGIYPSIPNVKVNKLLLRSLLSRFPLLILKSLLQDFEYSNIIRIMFLWKCLIVSLRLKRLSFSWSIMHFWFD